MTYLGACTEPNSNYVSPCLCVHRSVRNTAASTRRIFFKFHIDIF
jgi:hypothetical protein